MGAHRCVNAHAAAQIFCPHHLIVEGFAHAVQALEFKILVLPHLVNRRQGVGVVGGKLGKHRIRRGQEFACASQIRHIGVRLAGVHRVAVHAVYLRPFHFAVPISAFH